LISYRKAPGKIQILAIGSLAGLHRKTDRCRSNSGEGAHRRQGTSGGKGLGAHGGHGDGRCWGREGPRWRVDGEQRRAAELRGAASVFRWLDGRRAVEKRLDSFYAMMWCWWGAWPGLRGGGLTGRRRGRAAAEARAHRRCGPGDLVQENKIGRACELQWVTVVLLEH
jgi:hypothetical protein